MIRWLTSVRLSGLQLGAVAVAAALATALVIADGTPGATRLEAEVAAVLGHRSVVVHHLGGRSSPAPAATAQPAASSAVAPVSSSPPESSSAPVPSSAPTTTAGAAPTTSIITTPSTPSSSSSTPSSTSTPTIKVKHVFVIALTTTSYAAAFDRGSVAHYLDHTLVPQGTLLTQYQTLGRSELSDYLAMISGQAPNADTSADCTSYAEFPAAAKPNAAGMVRGDGCIYPVTTLTIGDQVTGSGHVWKAYIDGLGSTTCVHPDSGALDNAPLPGAAVQYDTRHNPFIYFHSLLDLGDCANDDEDLRQLGADLRSPSRTPTYAYIAPGLCDDSSQASCPDGQPGGLVAEDAFLKQWVPTITRSAAYRRSGALIIVFTISKPAGSAAVSGSKTGRPARAGALVISPYATPRRRVATRYGPYSVLRSIEQLLGLTPLAKAESAKSFAGVALPGT